MGRCNSWIELFTSERVEIKFKVSLYDLKKIFHLNTDSYITEKNLKKCEENKDHPKYHCQKKNTWLKRKAKEISSYSEFSNDNTRLS